MTPQGVLPPVVVLPVVALCVLVVTAHLIAMHAAEGVPLSRRRIRTAGGGVMLVTSLVLAYAFSFVRPDDPVRFTAAWTGAIMMLTMVLFLGGLDALNNVRLARLQRRRLRRGAGALHEQLAKALAEAAPKNATDPATDLITDPITDHDQPPHTQRKGQSDT